MKQKKKTSKSPSAAPHVPLLTASALEKPICPSIIKGIDDSGNYYNSHDELTTIQGIHRAEFYSANAAWWGSGGYNGRNDDEAMVGDGGAIEDGEEGLKFLDRLLATKDFLHLAGAVPLHCRFKHAVDLGAGAGRVTKLVLLKRYDEVRLVEADKSWSKRSRTYLGKKKAARCSFVNRRLDDLSEDDVANWGEPADLMWVQWTLQYLIDEDVVDCLRTLAGGLRPSSGVLIVKENRPFGIAREDRFQMDLPGGDNERFDITRPDAHHRLLFQKAGLKVTLVEKGVETNTYALMRS